MGIALDRLGEVECRRIAETLFHQTRERAGSELNGRCPLPGHDDQQPSFSYNYAKDVFKCKGCGGAGDLVVLWGEVNGIGDKKEQFKAFCREFGIDRDGPRGRAKKRRRKRPGKAQAQPKKDDSPVISEEEWAKYGPLPEKWVERLEQKRGWSRETIRELDLRFGKIPGAREPRILIPVRDEEGKLRNIRGYLPGQKPKVVSFGKGYGGGRLWPVSGEAE